MHFNTTRAVTAAARTRPLEIPDLELVVTTLSEQRDAGQELDQWMTLAAAAQALSQFGHNDLAVQAAHGVNHSPWGGLETDPHDALTYGLAELPESTPPRDLHDLVDEVLMTLRELINELA